MPRFARESSREDNNTPDLFHSNKKEKKKEGKRGNKKGGGVEYARPSYPPSESQSWKEKALNWPADANSRFNIFHDRDKSTY